MYVEVESAARSKIIAKHFSLVPCIVWIYSRVYHVYCVWNMASLLHALNMASLLHALNHLPLSLITART